MTRSKIKKAGHVKLTTSIMG